jgi:hypothetical protein
MLNLLDDALASLLRAELGPGANGLDIAFGAPDRDWSSGLSRPTVNCYLWSVTPAGQGNVAGFEQVVEGDRAYRRMALPRVDLRYLITAWADDPSDEHMILGAALKVFARPHLLDSEHLPRGLASLTQLPLLQLAGQSVDDRADFWSTLGGQYRPGIDLVVTVPVEVGELLPIAPAPDRVEVAVTDTTRPERSSGRHWFRRAG